MLSVGRPVTTLQDAPFRQRDVMRAHILERQERDSGRGADREQRQLQSIRRQALVEIVRCLKGGEVLRGSVGRLE